jgi:hypothetical protein
MSADHNLLVIKTTITIADIEPPIWRRLLLPRELNFAQLHEVIQAAFGWTDSHLHQFVVGGLVVGAPEVDRDRKILEATEIALRDLFLYPSLSLTSLGRFDIVANFPLLPRHREYRAAHRLIPPFRLMNLSNGSESSLYTAAYRINRDHLLRVRLSAFAGSAVQRMIAANGPCRADASSPCNRSARRARAISCPPQPTRSPGHIRRSGSRRSRRGSGWPGSPPRRHEPVEGPGATLGASTGSGLLALRSIKTKVASQKHSFSKYVRQWLPIRSPEASGQVVLGIVVGLLFSVGQSRQHFWGGFPGDLALEIEIPHRLPGFFVFAEDFGEQL